MTHKALHNKAPLYIKDMIVPQNNTNYLLRSNDKHLVVTEEAEFKYGDRSFCCAAPVLWNELPIELRSMDKLEAFKSSLKTYLFRLAFDV